MVFCLLCIWGCFCPNAKQLLTCVTQTCHQTCHHCFFAVVPSNLPHKNMKSYKEDFVRCQQHPGSCCASAFPKLGVCVCSTVIFSWPHFKPCLYCSYCLLTSAVASSFWMAMTLPFFNVRSRSSSISSLQQGLDVLLQAGLSALHLPRLQTCLWPPLAVMQQCTKQQVL